MMPTPRFAYVVAVFLGLVAAFAPANLPVQSSPFYVALLASSGIFALAGLLCGLLWRRPGWRWGVWIVAPGLLLVTLGVISSGDFGSFLGDDLPFVVTGFIGASLGAAIGARRRSGGPATPS